ncbi:MAG: alanine--tRNA ligase [Pseudomonadota bacterium]
MNSAEVRARFIEFFEKQGHTAVASSSLVPGNDPTLLFTNAGMVQFKDVFLGRDDRPYQRAVSSQRCVRAGGKHNDLENVGYTARHHTFFEMLGNFSFGDYFKREAIHFAWAFLTRELALPPERLWVTVYIEDSEAERIWLEEIGVDPARLTRIAGSDNFWSMGDTGPCGPCSEIFFDHGPEIAGGPPGSPDQDGDRYIEIWNLVFMQYERSADGVLTPLPQPSVDTGMGLERIAAVMQRVHSNYEIDLFQHLLRAVAAIAGIADEGQASLRVVADHIRSCAFLITDGVVPSNEGRGYVLRRIVRRAIRHGYKLGIRDVFFYRLVQPLVEQMGDAYPELKQAQSVVEQVLRKEEERFAETLEQGMRILEAAIRQLDGRTIPGETAFLLYDTYGFPLDLTADVAREQGYTVDQAGFDIAMDEQRRRARAASHFSVDYTQDIQIDADCQFVGYEHLEADTTVLALFRDGIEVDVLKAGESGMVVLDETPFYAESGGQAGDAGYLRADSASYRVHDTQKQGGHLILHHGAVEQGQLSRGMRLHAEVSAGQRTQTALNHTATHLLHAALRQHLGEHVGQKGSLVNAERLRFDFSHFEPMTQEQLLLVEKQVNAQIRANVEVLADVMAKDDALQLGAMALFGEKYGDEVRVLRVGGFSTELCGGTHARRSGDIGFFRIVGETGVAAGVRRIEAVTGAGAMEWVIQGEQALQRMAERLKTARDGVEGRIDQLIERGRTLEKEIERLRGKLASAAGSDLAASAVDVEGIRVLAAQVDDVDPKALRDMVDQLKNKLGSAAVVLATVQEGRVSLVAGVTADLTGRIKAGDLIGPVAQAVGGKGGGRPDMAQAGGSDAAALPQALTAVPGWIRGKLTA